jgi:hypothetical protein
MFLDFDDELIPVRICSLTDQLREMLTAGQSSGWAGLYTRGETAILHPAILRPRD